MALKDRYTAKPMGAAYQGAMESVFAIVIGVLLGWWADRSFDSSPWGVLAGATIGFAAFVLRLTRLGSALSAPTEDGESPDGSVSRGPTSQDRDRNVGPSVGRKNGEP